MNSTVAYHPPSTLRRTAAALGALLAAAAILFAVPAILWALVGWPLPTELPSATEVRHALGTDLSDRAFIDVHAVIAWVIWAWLAWSLLAEIGAAVRHRTRRPRPFGGPFQTVATRIVASMSMLVVSGLPNATTASAATPSTAHPLDLSPDRDAPTGATPLGESPAVALATTAPPSQPAPALATYVVQRRDSLWSIAEQQLGDGLRWREIWDLNRGRDFGGFAFNDPNRLFSGWQLTLPVPAMVETPPPAPAAENIEPADPMPATCDASPTTTEAPPTETAGSPTTADTTSSSTSAGPTTSTATGPQSDPGPTADSTAPANTSVPLIAGGVALATGILLVLERYRRTQARRRRPGQAPHHPDPTTAATELAVRRTADPERVRRLDAALTAFTANLAGDARPALSAVRASATDIEVLLERPLASTPPGFIDNGDQRAFTTEPDISTAALHALGGDQVHPWPALVSVGLLGDDTVMVDIESASVLSVIGADRADHIRRIAIELATSPTADMVDLLVVDPGVDVAGCERIERAECIDDALARLETVAANSAPLDNAPNGRDRRANDGRGVTVFVSLHPLTDEQAGRLRQVARPGSGVAAVVAAEEASGRWWSLTVGATIRLEPHGFELGPLPLTTAALQRLDELVADAAVGDESIDDGSDEEPESVSAVHLDDRIDHAAPTDAETDVEVQVLGPVDVDGVDANIRMRSIEVIAYLALHRRGVTGDQLKTAIWPDKTPSPGTFSTTVYRARTMLGVDRNGNHHLPHAGNHDPTYTLGPHVITDLDRFYRSVQRGADADESAVEMAELRTALDLVRGQPFEGVAGFEWAFTEGFVIEAEATIADAAHRLAQLALQRGDATEAMWAACRGLAAVPGSEPLYRDRMEAAHLQGDPAAVDRIVEELIRYVETSDPLDDLHPDTIALWRRYGRSRRSTTGTD